MTSKTSDAIDWVVVKETINRLLAPPDAINDSEKLLIDHMADDLELYEHRALAEIAALIAHRLLEYKGVLLALLAGAKDYIGHTKSVIGATEERASNFARIAALQEELASLLGDALKQRIVDSKQRGKQAADDRHSLPGGSHEKRDAIRAIWNSGKYGSRDLCAEKESRALGMSFSTARKALRNSPKPT